MRKEALYELILPSYSMKIRAPSPAAALTKFRRNGHTLQCGGGPLPPFSSWSKLAVGHWLTGAGLVGAELVLVDLGDVSWD